MTKIGKIEVKQLSRKQRAMLIYREKVKMMKDAYPDFTEDEQINELINIGERSE